MDALRAAWKLAALKQSRPLFLRCIQAALKCMANGAPDHDLNVL